MVQQRYNVALSNTVLSFSTLLVLILYQYVFCNIFYSFISITTGICFPQCGQVMMLVVFFIHTSSGEAKSRHIGIFSVVAISTKVG